MKKQIKLGTFILLVPFFFACGSEKKTTNGDLEDVKKEANDLKEETAELLKVEKERLQSVYISKNLQLIANPFLGISWLIIRPQF